jgi:hypothetical protein
MVKASLNVPDSDQISLVTQLQMNILDSCFIYPKRIETIAKELAKSVNNISFICNNLEKDGYMKRSGIFFQSVPGNYVVADRRTVSLSKVQVGERVSIAPIEKPVIADEVKLEITKLHKIGLSRSEIAKRLVISKTDVIWTLMEVNKI